VTGRGAYELIQRRFRALKHTAALLASIPEETPAKAEALLNDLANTQKQMAALRRELAAHEFDRQLENAAQVKGVRVLAAALPGADADTLRSMCDRFRQRFPSGVALLASVDGDGRPMLVASVSEDLVKRGLNAGDLVKVAAQPLGGSGGGRPTLAQAGGKDASRLDEALASVLTWVEQKLK
jgi:alanyl-tRNA synthetase